MTLKGCRILYNYNYNRKLQYLTDNFKWSKRKERKPGRDDFSLSFFGIYNLMSMNKRKPFLNAIACALLAIFARKTHKHTTKDLEKAEFKTSTQSLGIRFTEKIRDVFRFKWIRHS